MMEHGGVVSNMELRNIKNIEQNTLNPFFLYFFFTEQRTS